MSGSNRQFDLLIFIPYLGVGGSERVLVNIANEYAHKNRKVAVCILIDGGDFESDLNDNVKVLRLNLNRVIFSLFKIIKIIKSNPSKVVFSSLWHMNVLIGLSRIFYSNKDCKYIARETNIQSLNGVSFLKKTLLTYSYKLFDTIIAQSLDMKFDLVENFSVSNEKVNVINNGVNVDEIIAKSQEGAVNNMSSDVVKLITVGKLEHQKGYDNLLDTFSICRFPSNYHLYIIGDGSQYENLMDKISDLDLHHQVFLIGKKKNPYKYVKSADVFISSSRYEGFPNVVLEALVCGVPVVSNTYLGGISEIINSSNGVICDIKDHVEFKNALANVLCLDKYKIMDESQYKFSLEKMMCRYENLFN